MILCHTVESHSHTVLSPVVLEVVQRWMLLLDKDQASYPLKSAILDLDINQEKNWPFLSVVWQAFQQPLLIVRCYWMFKLHSLMSLLHGLLELYKFWITLMICLMEAQLLSHWETLALWLLSEQQKVQTSTYRMFCLYSSTILYRFQVKGTSSLVVQQSHSLKHLKLATSPRLSSTKELVMLMLYSEISFLLLRLVILYRFLPMKVVVNNHSLMKM